MKIALLAAALALAGCVSMPEPGTASRDQADNKCQVYAYQQAEWGWGALGGLGAAIGYQHAKQDPEYSQCMAHAGYAEN